MAFQCYLERSGIHVLRADFARVHDVVAGRAAHGLEQHEQLGDEVRVLRDDEPEHGHVVHRVVDEVHRDLVAQAR